MATTRRSSSLLLAGVLGACTWSAQNFVGFFNGRSEGIAMRGFKEDFMQWKSTLSSDEKAMLLRQTRGEFDKKYRKTEDFSKNIPEEKVEAFSKVLQKFLDSEMEDYVKQRDAKAPDYDRLKKKCAVKAYDWSLSNTIVEIDRDAMRMEDLADARVKAALEKGELVPNGARCSELWMVKNDDEESHKRNVENLEAFTEWAGKNEKFSGVAAELRKAGVPPVGEKYGIEVPEFLAKQLVMATDLTGEIVNNETTSEEDKNEARAALPAIFGDLTKKFVDEVSLLKQYADDLKEIAKAENYVEGKTRGQWARELHEAITDYNKKNKMEPPPPLDEEHIAELDKVPCTKPSDPEYRNPWQTGSILYKSEAYDSFGSKYLLGIYETKEEAEKVFDQWNAEYEEARAQLKEETIQWGKQEQARLDKDPAAQERVRKAVEEARR